VSDDAEFVVCDQTIKLLQSWRWSAQKPEQRARQRDEAAIESWVTERWPAIKKAGRRRGSHAALPR
jgi:hypothetical protein